ncbi:MAG: flagellar hook-length control protein FliK [Gammaproteobacteria bacterium]|nr:flagellar hook-length control protein FliK [Gammaproteobacteria bacterium]
MRLSDIISNPRLAIETTKSSALQSLRPGQTLRAQVIGPVANQTVALNIGNSKVLARTPIPLTTGQQLTLEVTKGGQLPVLKLLGGITPERIKTEALKTALPRQQPLREFFQYLRTATTVPQSRPQASSPQVSNTGQQAASQMQLAPVLKSALQTLSTPSVSGQVKTPQPIIHTTIKQTPLTTTPTTSNNQNQTPSPAIKSNFGVETTRLINNVLQHGISSREPVTAHRLIQLMHSSGLFLERNLGSGTAPGTDLKSSLLQLLALLRPALKAQGELAPQTGITANTSGPASTLGKFISELLMQTEGALARVLTNQLTSLQESNVRPMWQLEIPVQRDDETDNFLLKIEQEIESEDSENKNWSVWMDFDLPSLGRVRTHIRLQDDLVSSQFMTEARESADKINNKLPLLEDALQRAGLKVAKLGVRQQELSEPEVVTPPVSPLLDEKV